MSGAAVHGAAIMSSAAALPIAVAFSLVFVELEGNVFARNLCDWYHFPHGPDSILKFLAVFVPTMVVVLAGTIAIVVLTGGEQQRDTATLQLAGLLPSDSMRMALLEALALSVVIVVISALPALGIGGLLAILLASKGYAASLVGINLIVVLACYLGAFLLLAALLLLQTRAALKHTLIHVDD